MDYILKGIKKSTQDINMVFELNLKLQHSCYFAEFAQECFGKRKVLEYCGETIDYIILPTPLSDEILDKGQLIFPPDKNLSRLGNATARGVIILDCMCGEEENSLVAVITKIGGMIIFPIRYENGYEMYKIFCHSLKEVSTTLNHLNERVMYLEILSIKNIGNNSLLKQSSILSYVIENLTEKQLNVILKGFEKGYYQIPRNIRLQDLAEELAVTRHAIERNIRSAENKVLTALIPYLYIYKYGNNQPDITDRVLQNNLSRIKLRKVQY